MGFDLSEIFGTDVSFLIEPYETTAQQKNIAPNCNNLKRITVDSANPYYRAWGGVLFSRDMTELYCYPAGKAASIYIMPSTVEHFYDAFGGLYLANASIRYVGELDPMDNDLLPEGWIDFGAALQLENVVLSANVAEIGKAAFYNTGITSIFIPKSVTAIGEKAFWHCRNLTTVGFDRGSVYTELPKACFQDCEALQNVTFGKIEYLSDGVACGGIAAQTAADEPCEPVVALTLGDYILELGTDYLLAYSDNTAPGTAHVTVTGIGNFTGELALTFEITAAPPLPDAVLPGDVSGDGVLALADYALLASACVGALQLTEAQYKAADLNNDGAVDGFDLALLDLKRNTSVGF